MKQVGRRLATLLLGCLAALQGGADESADEAARAAMLADGRALTAQFDAGEIEAVWERFGEQMRSAMGSADALRGFRAQVEQQLGAEEEVLQEAVRREGEFMVYQRIGRWRLAPMPILVIWAVGADGKVEGFHIRPAPPQAAPAPSQAPLPQGRLPDDEQVRAQLRAFIDQPGSAPGVVVGLGDARGVRFLALGDAGDGALPDADTVFEAGSITKGLTGLLLAQMAAAGEVRLDQPIAGLLPEGPALAPELAAITLADLARHRAGLPRLAGGPEMQARMTSEDPYAGSTPAEIFADLARVPPETVRAGHGRFAYSNLGAALLGQLLARAAGEPYESLLAKRVFAPLDLPAPVLDPDAVTGRQASATQAGRPVPHWHLDAYAPTGGWQASARDLHALGVRLLESEPGWVAAALQRVELPGHPERGMGLGWHHGVVGDREIIWHNGGTAGSSSFLGIVPSEGLVVAVLANGGGGIVDGLARSLLASGR